MTVEGKWIGGGKMPLGCLKKVKMSDTRNGHFGCENKKEYLEKPIERNDQTQATTTTTTGENRNGNQVATINPQALSFQEGRKNPSRTSLFGE